MYQTALADSQKLTRIAVIIAAHMLFSFGETPGGNAQGFTPRHPTVEKLVDQLISKLETPKAPKTHYDLKSVFHGGYGEIALAGYAHFKARHNDSNPVVVRGIEAAKQVAKRLGDPVATGGNDKTVYVTAVCILLLAEVDPENYVSELKRLNKHLERVQHPSGAYSYRGYPTGDVSQTQYAMLALWKLDRLGIRIDDKGVAKTGRWLMAVQDIGGGWPYQGQTFPGGKRGRQAKVTASMAVAGGSALLIAGDILRSWGATFGDADDPGIAGLPDAVRLHIGAFGDGPAAIKASLPAEPMVAAIADCDQWLSENSSDPGKVKSYYPYYQLYTQERYQSFREVALEEPDPESPAWYNAGVKYIQQHAKEGLLDSTPHTTSITSNAFAILFLIRSTKKSIAALSAGSMTGGWGLPDDTSEVKVDGSQIKGKEVAASVTSLLSILEDDDADALDGKSIPDNLQLAKDLKERKDQLDRLERLARGSQSWQARRVAMRLLGQSDEMRMVPTLIFGLSDKDTVVRRYARDGLRFISRKFDGFGLPDKSNDKEVFAAEQKWKKWYLTVDPTFLFID